MNVLHKYIKQTLLLIFACNPLVGDEITLLTTYHLAPLSVTHGSLYSELSVYFYQLDNSASRGRETYKSLVENSDFVDFEKRQERFYKPLRFSGIVPAVGLASVVGFHLVDAMMNKMTKLTPEIETEYKAKAEKILQEIFEIARTEGDDVVLRALTYVKDIVITNETELVASHGKDIASGTLYLSPRLIDDGAAKYLIFRRAMGLKFSNEVMLREGYSTSISESFWSRYIAYHFSKRDAWWSFSERKFAISNGLLASFSRGKDKRLLKDYPYRAYSDPLQAVSNRLMAYINAEKGDIRKVTFDEFFPWKPDPSDGRFYDEERIAKELFESIRQALITLLEAEQSENDIEALKKLFDRSRELKTDVYLIVADQMGVLPSYNVVLPKRSFQTAAAA